MLEKFFAKPQTWRSPGIQQPAGRRRIAQLLALGLRKETRDDVIRELSLMPAVSFPFYSPEQELLLAGEDILVQLDPFPIKDDDFRVSSRPEGGSAGG